jgi:predicted ATPase/class 3 adenylate cyclase
MHCDPEVLRDVQRRVHEAAYSIFQSNGGSIDHIAGDGGCGYFGVPLPVENGATGAVSAALELIREIEEAEIRVLNQGCIKLRIGVGTSTVIVSDALDRALAFSHEVVGAAPVLADRLQKIANPNAVLVCSTTHALTRMAIDYEPLGERTLKGFDDKQKVWRAIARRAADSRFSLLRSARTEFVSRDDEFEVLTSALQRAVDGKGSAFSIVGEPGIGKSRLVDELLHASAARDFEVRLLQCQPRASIQPLFPLIEYLFRYTNRPENRNKIVSQRKQPSISEVVPGLSSAAVDALSSVMIRKATGVGSLLVSFGRNSDDIRASIVAAAVEVVLCFLARHRQILVIEDLHWADSITLDVFSELARRSRDIALVLIGTSRDPTPDQVGTPPIHLLKLERLSFSAVKRLVNSVWSGASASQPRVQFIFNRSEGVPLFVEEITKRLRARLPTGTTSTADWERVVRDEGLASIKEILAARLASVGNARHLAQIASTLGREFSLPVVAQLMPPETAVEQLEDQAAALIAEELVEADGSAQARKFRFRHSLVQEVAHDSLLKTDLRKLHGRISELALDGAIPEIDETLLAWHFEQAGQPLRSAQFAIAAAETHASRSAMQEADQLLSMAENSLSDCEADEEYVGLMLRLLTVRGVVASVLHGTGSPSSREAYERGVEICTAKAVEEREKWFPLYWGYWYTAPNFATQRQRAQTILNDFASSSDREIRLQAHHCAWGTTFNCGQHSECLSYIDQGLAAYDPERAVESRFRYGHDAKVCGLGETALIRWLLGNTRTASISLDLCLTWASTIDHIGSTCHALDIAIMHSYYCRDIGQISDLAHQISELARYHSLPDMDAKSKIFGGWARAMGGSLRSGLADVEDGLDILRRVGTPEDFPVYNELKAHLLGQVGRLDDALLTLDETIEQALAAGHLFWLPELYRRRALLRKQRGDALENSLKDVRAAQAEARHQGAIGLLARTERSIGFLMGDEEETGIQFD